MDKTNGYNVTDRFKKTRNVFSLDGENNKGVSSETISGIGNRIDVGKGSDAVC